MIRTLSSIALAGAVSFACTAFADEGQHGGIPIPPVEAHPDLNNNNVPDRDEENQRVDKKVDALSQSEQQKLSDELGPMTAQNVVNNLHKDNVKEIALGQLAVQKAQSEELRQFGERLIKDHQKADEKLKATAKEQGLMVKEPQFDEKHQDKMAKLQELSGEEFDKEFLRVIDKGHTKTLFMLRKAEEEVGNEAIANLVAELQPTIRQHDRIASDLRGEMEVAEGEDLDIEEFTQEVEEVGATPI